MNPIDAHPVSKMAQLRRSQRVCLRLPVTVLRKGPGANVASEETHTLMVNAHGALLQLALTVELGQLLSIKNTKTMEELVCRVVHLGPEYTNKREVGVEFEVPAPRFWRIAFPPDDWTTHSPDAKAPTQHVFGGRAPAKRPAGLVADAEKKLANKLPGPVQR
jgi:hypothetical protein